MTECEIEARALRRIARMHQLTHDIVDGGDVIGVHRVTQAEHPGQQRGHHHRGPVGKQCKGPGPGCDVGEDESAEQQDRAGTIHKDNIVTRPAPSTARSQYNCASLGDSIT